MIKQHSMFRKPVAVYRFAGLSIPRHAAMLPRGTMQERLKRRKTSMVGPYIIDPPLSGDSARLFYLDSAFVPGLRRAWCDQIPGSWDNEELPPRIDHEGWYINDGDESIRGIVFKLPKSKGFLAGWSMGEGMLSLIETTIYTDIRTAGYAADALSENYADECREESEVLEDEDSH